MQTNRRLWISLMMTLPLAACGFQLRGSRSGANLPFSSVHLEIAKNSPIERELRNAILSQGNTAIATDRKSADITLRVLSEITDCP